MLLPCGGAWLDSGPLALYAVDAGGSDEAESTGAVAGWELVASCGQASVSLCGEGTAAPAVELARAWLLGFQTSLDASQSRGFLVCASCCSSTWVDTITTCCPFQYLRRGREPPEQAQASLTVVVRDCQPPHQHQHHHHQPCRRWHCH